MGLLCMWITLYWWQTREVEMQIVMVQVYVMRWKPKFNSRKSKIKVVWGKECGTS